MNLQYLECPECQSKLIDNGKENKRAYNFNDCNRKCVSCGIGFSNSKDNPTLIYNDFRKNVPNPLLLENLEIVMGNSINETNKNSKKIRFGYSTSEDALTWNFISYFIVKNRKSDLLNLLGIESESNNCEIYLWGANMNINLKEDELIKRFKEISKKNSEESTRMTEPDIMIKTETSITFIEVKYLSGNAISQDFAKFEKYHSTDTDIEEVINSGHYELFRNWVFVSELSNKNPFRLINLGPSKLFNDSNRDKLNLFKKSLNSENGKFIELSWESILQMINPIDYDEWFVKYLQCKLNFKKTLS